MVPTPIASDSEPLAGLVNTSWNVSLLSATPSAEAATCTVLLSSPGENTSVPDTAE